VLRCFVFVDVPQRPNYAFTFAHVDGRRRGAYCVSTIQAGREREGNKNTKGEDRLLLH
jgi:hypothetical protein